MVKSTITPCLELKEVLLQMGEQVSNFQQKRRNAVDEWIKWLVQAEEILKKYNFSESSTLAALRATLLSKSDSEDQRQQRKKARLRAALETVEPAQQAIYEKQKALEVKIEQARDVIRQITIAIQHSGVMPFDPQADFNQFIESYLQIAQQHQQLAPSINNVVASIGKFDTLRILAEEIEF